jgi:hypothetical protein
MLLDPRLNFFVLDISHLLQHAVKYSHRFENANPSEAALTELKRPQKVVIFYFSSQSI